MKYYSSLDMKGNRIIDCPDTKIEDKEPEFSEATTRTNIASCEKMSIILGKIKKFFTDLKTVAFSGSYNDLTNKPTIPTKVSELTNDRNYIATSFSGYSSIKNDNDLLTNYNIKKAIVSTRLQNSDIKAGTTVALSTLMNGINDYKEGSFIIGANFIGFKMGCSGTGGVPNINFNVGTYYISENRYALFKGSAAYIGHSMSTFAIKDSEIELNYNSTGMTLFFEIYYTAV